MGHNVHQNSLVQVRIVSSSCFFTVLSPVHLQVSSLFTGVAALFTTKGLYGNPKQIHAGGFWALPVSGTVFRGEVPRVPG